MDADQMNRAGAFAGGVLSAPERDRAYATDVPPSPRPPHLDVIHERIECLGSNLMELRDGLKVVCTRLLGSVNYKMKDGQVAEKVAEKTGKLNEIEQHIQHLVELTHEIQEILRQIQQV